ncbi:MAG: STAS-like domain-containing protein, partial [Synechococcus lacustris]
RRSRNPRCGLRPVPPQAAALRHRHLRHGRGLLGSYEIVLLNGGTYQIWTGDVVFALNKGKRRPGFQGMPPLLGTGVECLFLNQLTEFASDSGLDLASECIHTGGRAPAKLLRRKIQGLLPAMDGEPLILDFSGVKSAASSFHDELLGRLAAEDPRGQAMANVVVAQRLGRQISG